MRITRFTQGDNYSGIMITLTESEADELRQFCAGEENDDSEISLELLHGLQQVQSTKGE